MASRVRQWSKRLATESGFRAIATSCWDTKILCMQRFVRLFAYGATFLILAQFLSTLDLSDDKIGLFMTSTLLGDVVLSFILTAITDAIGRRRVLAAGAVMLIFSGLVFYLSDNYWILLIASIFGVISPSGNEIGPFKAIEESVLAQLTPKELRSDIFAWYTLFGTAGAAMGTLTCGWTIQALQGGEAWGGNAVYKVVFLVYAGLGGIKLFLNMMLSSAIEVEKSPALQDTEPDSETGLLAGQRVQDGEEEESFTPTLLQRARSLFPYISPASRHILWRLLILFCFDSFASGMASPSWLTYFFTTVHHLQPGTLGTLFLTTNVLATFSNLAALPLARRIGPLKTMVFTHLPSAIFLALIPLPTASSSTGTWVAMGLLALRACTNSMDQAPRQAFLSAAVQPAERTAVLGVVNVVKTLAQAGGIGTSGFLANASLWVVALGGAGALKAFYDLFMLWMFVRVKHDS